MNKCIACNHETADGDHLQCAKCGGIYHYLCLNIRPEDTADLHPGAFLEWICPMCMSKQPKGNNSELAARPSTPTSMAEISFNNVTRRKALLKLDTNTDNIENDYVCRSELREILREEIANALKSFTTKMTDGINAINGQLSSFKCSMDFMSERFDKISDEFKIQQQKMVALKKENDALRCEITTLNSKMNQLDQLSRASSLEIQCVPERKAENVVKIVKQLGNAVNYAVNDHDILYCSRVAKLDPTSLRPRTIVVKFSSPRIRDSVLSAVGRHNKENKGSKLNTHDFGFSTEEKKPVFVLENLSAENKQLHAAARKRGKELKYKFTWIRAGRIYMRKSETSDAIYIRNLETLEKLK